jgi:DNA (cytosine-5)-methyltransferase 1
VEVFSGAGGLSLGAKRAGIDVRMAIEKDYYAAETYKLNHPNTIMKNVDINTITKIDIEKDSTTLLFGGAPCQGFSISSFFEIPKN